MLLTFFRKKMWTEPPPPLPGCPICKPVSAQSTLLRCDIRRMIFTTVKDFGHLSALLSVVFFLIIIIVMLDLNNA